MGFLVCEAFLKGHFIPWQPCQAREGSQSPPVGLGWGGVEGFAPCALGSHKIMATCPQMVLGARNSGCKRF